MQPCFGREYSKEHQAVAGDLPVSSWAGIWFSFASVLRREFLSWTWMHPGTHEVVSGKTMFEDVQIEKHKPWTERLAKRGKLRRVSRGAWERRVHCELQARIAHKPWIKIGTKPCGANRELVRRFPMEPFLETLWGPLVPISACLCPLGVAILRYYLLFFVINCY